MLPNENDHVASATRRAVGTALALVMASSILVLGVSPAAAAPPYPAPVMRGYVPLAADATRGTLANMGAAVGTTLDFTVGITNAGPGAVIYYDHWEDGFEADLTNPAQSTTSIWGDGDPANGDAAATSCGARCAGDGLPAGAVFAFRNSIPTPRTTAVLWDGGDRVSSTRGFTITAGGFTTNLGSVLSASASAYDTSKWGVDYWIPVGENMVPPAGTSDAFASTSIQVMADQPGTVVEVDRTGDGVVDVTDTIGPGEVVFVDGGVNRGASVHASRPVQVHVGAGDPTATYEMRWFTLSAAALLSDDYLNPVGSSSDNQRTVTYLFNPSTDPITVSPSCAGCADVAVPARGGASFTSPLGQAVRFQSTGGEPFAAVGAVGSESGAAPGSAGDASSAYDWGFGLVPTQLLTAKAVLGWAPGNSNNPPLNPSGNRDDNPVWISAMDDTVLYVDRDGDPSTGALGPDCDGRYDQTIAVSALQSTRIVDTVDGDMTGASIYTCDGTLIAGAWGEDPANAPTGSPGFDAGYVLVPSTAMLVEKTAALATDTNGDGRFGPGDVVRYEVVIADAGALAFTDLHVVDPVPAGTAYIESSTTYDPGTGVSGPFADDAPPAATPYPFDEGGAALPTVDPGETVRIAYDVVVDDPFTAGTSITNTVTVAADQASGGAVVTTPLVTADLSLTKTVTTTPSLLGDDATYRIEVANAGPDPAGGVAVTDLLPPELAFVAATASVGTYDEASGLWDLGTIAAGSSATLDITATVNALTATNTAEVSASNAADPDSVPANGAAAEDDSGSAAVGVDSVADLSLTKVLTDGPEASGASTFTLTVVNAGPGPSTGVAVTDHAPADWTFVSSTGVFDGVTGVWTVPNLEPGQQAQIDVVYTTPSAAANYAQISASGTVDPDSTPDATPLADGNQPDEDDEAVAGVPAVADVSVTNTVTTPPTYVGDAAQFTVTVVNDGPTGTTDVVVVDLLPAGVELVTATPSVGAYAPVTGIWTVGDLTAGASATLVLDVRVLTAGPFTTTAEVTASTATDPDSTPGNGDPTEDDRAVAGIDTTGASLGDTVWFDVDADGEPDPGEPGLEAVTMTARWFGPNGTDGDGDDVAYVATTGSGGAWSLAGLPFGSYTVDVDATTLPDGITTATRDRDGTGSPDTTDLTVAGGESITDVDFAYVGAGVIGDTVFIDTDGNGVADAGEGAAGVAVHLAWHTLTFDTTTDAGGGYSFANLPSGDFQVTVDAAALPAGVANTADPDGGGDSAAAVNLAAGTARLDLDFGYRGTGSIGDTAFTDADGDGMQDPGESGLGGVEVTLASGGTTIEAVLTAADGSYGFADLLPGSYTVTATIPGGLEATTPMSYERSLDGGETFTAADFGLRAVVPPASIGDLVWDDADGDGQHDAGEPGVEGVELTIVDTAAPDVTIGTTTTAADGSYSFDGLQAASYSVRLTVPAGRVATTSAAVTAAVAAGDVNTDVDFGLRFPPPAPVAGSIGDLVWDDLDGDGVRDAAEPGLAQVAVTLRADTDGDGVFETAVGTTASAEDGSYGFAGLDAGAYQVEASVPEGRDATTAEAAAVALSPGERNLDVDFGFATDVTPVSAAEGPANAVDVALVKTADGAAVVGQPLGWSLVVTNAGTSATPAGLTIVDPLPAGLAFVSATGDGWSCATDATIVTCTGASLAPGAASTIQLTTMVTAAAGAGIRNTAVVAGLAGEALTTNNWSGAEVIAAPAPAAGPELPTITAQSATPPQTTELPRTGADIIRTFTIGMVLIIGGVLALAVARRETSC